jgi:hypothetical protein
MDRIVTYLSDPAWWFTAVFVAVLSSIAAAFLKDAFLSIFSKISVKYKILKQKRDANFEEEVNECINDNTLLILKFCKVILQTCLLTTLSVCYFVSYLSYISLPAEAHAKYKIMIGFLVILTGSTVTTGMLLYPPRISAATTAYKKYRINMLNRKKQ